MRGPLVAVVSITAAKEGVTEQVKVFKLKLTLSGYITYIR